jgi:hypothetical protein
MAATMVVVSKLEQRRYISTHHHFPFVWRFNRRCTVSLDSFSFSTVATVAKHFLYSYNIPTRTMCIYYKAESACTNIHNHD